MDSLNNYQTRERFFHAKSKKKGAGMADLTTTPGAAVRFISTCRSCSALIKGSNGTHQVIEAGELVPTKAPGKYLVTAIHVGLDDFTITLHDEDDPARSIPPSASDTGRELTSLTYVVAE